MSKLVIVQTPSEKKSKEGYTPLSRYVLNDQRLSWKAKGLHSFLVTRPPTANTVHGYYDVTIRKLASQGKGSHHQIESALRELRECGYLNISTDGDPVWTIYEEPQNVEVALRLPRKTGREVTPKTGYEITRKTGTRKTGCINNNEITKNDELSLSSYEDRVAAADAGDNTFISGKSPKANGNGHGRSVAQEILQYLNKATGRNFPLTTSTQWHINARLHEGASVDDFKRVIDTQHEAWGNNNKMAPYLRPVTLFGARFWDYRNAAIKPRPSKKSIKFVGDFNEEGSF